MLNLKGEATLDDSSKKCINVILTWWDKFFVHQFDLQKGFPGGSVGKESACNVGDQSSIPGSGKSPGEGNGYPLQYSCLENPMNRGAWRATVQGVAKNQTWLNDKPFLSFPSFQFSSVAKSCPALCDPMDCSIPGLPVHRQLLEPTQTHVHWVDDAIQPSHPLSSPSPPAFSLSQHQGLFQGVSSSHQVAKVLEF